MVSSDGVSDDWFGFSVAMSGDTAVIGAPGDSDAGHHSGSVYVFVRVGSAWYEQAKLVASDALFGDTFGYSVAVDGETVVVGSRAHDDAGNNSGSAYVFVRSGTTWTEQAKLGASDGAALDNFGSSIAISGDTVVVGATGSDSAGNGSGAGYIFVRSGT